MKKILGVLTAVALVLCLVACDNETVEIQANINDIRFWTDTETGVQYVIYNNHERSAGMGGITPRLNADGTLYHPTEKGGVEE